MADGPVFTAARIACWTHSGLAAGEGAGYDVREAIAYIRVSTQGRRAAVLGLEAQADAIRRFAEAEGYRIAETFEEHESGKGADALDRRPKLAAKPHPNFLETADVSKKRRPYLHCLTIVTTAAATVVATTLSSNSALADR